MLDGGLGFAGGQGAGQLEPGPGRLQRQLSDDHSFSAASRSATAAPSPRASATRPLAHAASAASCRLLAAAAVAASRAAAATAGIELAGRRGRRRRAGPARRRAATGAPAGGAAAAPDGAPRPGVASGQRQGRGQHRRFGLRLDAAADCGQQPLGLLQPPLTQPQGSQPGERPAMQSGAGAIGDPRTGVQLALGVVPPALGGQHAAVVDAALGVQERAAVAGQRSRRPPGTTARPARCRSPARKR